MSSKNVRCQGTKIPSGIFQAKTYYSFFRHKLFFLFIIFLFSYLLSITNLLFFFIIFHTFSFRASSIYVVPICSTTFKFVNDMGPNYLNEVFQWAAESNRTLRNDYLKLKHPLRKTTAGQNSLSFLGFSKWKLLPEFTKKCNNIYTLKNNFKKLYLAQLAH